MAVTWSADHWACSVTFIDTLGRKGSVGTNFPIGTAEDVLLLQVGILEEKVSAVSGGVAISKSVTCGFKAVGWSVSDATDDSNCQSKLVIDMLTASGDSYSMEVPAPLASLFPAGSHEANTADVGLAALIDYLKNGDGDGGPKPVDSDGEFLVTWLVPAKQRMRARKGSK